MDDLSRYSDDELKAEMVRRETILKKKRPVKLAEPDWARLERTMAVYFDNIIANDYEDEDGKHYIYEAALEAVYGRSIWQWFKERSK